MQNQTHNSAEDKFAMNFGSFDPDLGLFASHMGGTMGGNLGLGLKRSAHDAGLDREHMGLSSDDECDLKDDKMSATSSNRDGMLHQQTSLDPNNKQNLLPNGKKTKGRVKIKMEFIDNKLRRYTTFSKRKTGIMKKAYELSTLTGTQVMLLVASETGHVYTFATRKLQPMITSEAGKALIQTCLNSPDPPPVMHHHDQRMSATGYEETELTYAVNEDDHKLGDLNEEYLGRGSSSPSDSSSPPSPSITPTPSPMAHLGLGCTSGITSGLPVQLPPGLVLTPSISGGSVMVGAGGGSMVYAGNGVMYATPPMSSLSDSQTPILLNFPSSLITQDQNNLSSRSPSIIADKSGGLPLYLTGGGAGNGSIGGSSNSCSQLLPLPITLASLQQSAAAAVAAAAAEAVRSSNSQDAFPTDLSMHIKRESRS